MVRGLFLAGLIGVSTMWAQQAPLDPTRGLVEGTAAKRAVLPEEFVWTAGDVTAQRADRSKFPWNRPDLRVAPHLFRGHFQVREVPKAATVYVAGPREAHVYLNGRLVEDFFSNVDAPIGFHVFHADVSTGLRVGENVLAVEAVRGRGVVSGGTTPATLQMAYGEVMAAKIVAWRFGVEGPALVVSDRRWRSAVGPVEHWAETGFEDAGWKGVESLGPVEGDVDLRQWSADAGMYGWPGYMGMSAALRTFSLKAAAVTHVFAGRGKFVEVNGPGGEFSVALRAGVTDAEAPSLLLDFGREVAGRLLVESGSDRDAVLSIAYGESEIEAMATGLTSGQQGGNYLGTNLLEVPAGGVARGPKSGFRYVRVRFLRGAPVAAFKSIRVEGIYYPVAFAGSFESSDALLNRIWETGAYTAHLCMQDGIWDAPKRDRGRWVGDMDVEGRVISTAFGDKALMEETLRALVEPGKGHVNGIPSYSALWITTLANFYQHSGDKEFLLEEREALVRVLGAMDADVEADGSFRNAKHRWLFVDWSPGLYGYTDEARVGTALQMVRGYRAAAGLFGELGDEASAAKYRAQAAKVLGAVHRANYGASWQMNALAVMTEDTSLRAGYWAEGLARVKQDAPSDPVVSPYFGAYLLDAMAEAGHGRQGLDWIRTYWGGMLAEGATSFWESYDLRWPKTNPHLSLQADGTSGYFVSMAHGWSAGPTAWLTENVLGVTPETPGYGVVRVRPDLMGLAFAKGSVPTPHGAISIRVDAKGIELDLPAGVERALVSYAGRETVVTGAGRHVVGR